MYLINIVHKCISIPHSQLFFILRFSCLLSTLQKNRLCCRMSLARILIDEFVTPFIHCRSRSLASCTANINIADTRPAHQPQKSRRKRVRAYIYRSCQLQAITDAWFGRNSSQRSAVFAVRRSCVCMWRDLGSRQLKNNCYDDYARFARVIPTTTSRIDINVVL